MSDPTVPGSEDVPDVSREPKSRRRYKEDMGVMIFKDIFRKPRPVREGPPGSKGRRSRSG